MRPAQGRNPLGRILTVGQTRMTIAIALTFLLLKASADGPCKKCDIEKVALVNDSIERLTPHLINGFLCTFDRTCDNSAEFSEWSNETLFLVILKEPNLFLEAISNNKFDNESIIAAIENPIHDLFDLQRTYDSIKTSKIKSGLKDRYLNAIFIAGQKDGQKLKR
jgi:hypothetical protein